LLRGDGDYVVSAEFAADHLMALSKAHVGCRAVSDCTGIEARVIQSIKNGRRKRIRQSTEERIMAVTEDSGSAGATTPAGPTKRLVRSMVRAGYTPEEIAEAMGYKTRKLQWINRERILVATKIKLEAVYQRLMERAAQRERARAKVA
jgi:hypothetical protein